jgi:hypothetical protein
MRAALAGALAQPIRHVHVLAAAVLEPGIAYGRVVLAGRGQESGDLGIGEGATPVALVASTVRQPPEPQGTLPAKAA